MERKPYYADSRGGVRRALRAWRAWRDRKPERVPAAYPYGEFSAPPRAVLVLLIGFAVFILIASLA